MSNPSDLINQQTILFFRVYREVSLPLYGAMIERICSSAAIPFEFATVLEDIGQFFVRLSDEINSELLRRGVLGDERDAVETVEARSEIMVERVMRTLTGRAAGIADPTGEPITPDVLRQTLKVAVAMAHGLPAAQTPVGSFDHRGVEA